MIYCFIYFYALCAKILNKTNIGIQDVINLDISVFTEQKINEINELIYNKYKELGGEMVALLKAQLLWMRLTFY